MTVYNIVDLSLREAKRRSNPSSITSYGFILNGLLPPTSVGVAMTLSYIKENKEGIKLDDPGFQFYKNLLKNIEPYVTLKEHNE